VTVALVVPAPHRTPQIPLVPSADGIGSVALTAYEHASHLAGSACHIPWELVAAIGYIESDHGQVGGDSLNAKGQEAFALEGVPLDGSPGVALILDPNGGYARAEGPMQFIPSSWASWRTDGNGDGRLDPQNIFDATATAARYLCAGNLDLSTLANQPAAITSYNDSPIYVKNVMNVEHAYALGLSADTVKLIPMPTTTCPATAKTPSTPTPTATPTPSATPTMCVEPAKKRSKKARPTTKTQPTPTSTPKPSPSPTPKPSPTPSPTPTGTPTPPPPIVVGTPQPSGSPTPTP